jgi:hypothetical protein
VMRLRAAKVVMWDPPLHRYSPNIDTEVIENKIQNLI